MTGEQALNLLKSDALAELKQIHGGDLLVLVEGQIGIIKRPNAQGDMTPMQYLEELKGAGALGAVVASALAVDGPNSLMTYESLQQMSSSIKSHTLHSCVNDVFYCTRSTTVIGGIQSYEPTIRE
jgi:hypothetical protein